MHVCVKTHIVPSQNDYREKIIIAAKTRRWIDWTCPKSAVPGDQVFFYVGADGLVACGTVKSIPEPSNKWKNRYAADIGSIKLLDTFVPLFSIRKEIPELKWARYPRSYVTLTAEDTSKLESLIKSSDTIHTDLEADGGRYNEGAVKSALINAYERSPAARKEAIRHHGAVCAICSFDFGKRYGPRMNGFIHVHHIRPLSQLRAGYKVNPKKDLIPICPNCHAVIHCQRKALTTAMVKSMYRPN